MTSALDARAWRNIGLITAAALAAYIGLRNLPRGSDISHNDFRPNDRSAPQFCDASNPQFIPVVSDASPVKMQLAETSRSGIAGEPSTLVFTLLTSSGKPIGPDDLLVTHTRLLHLLIIDPSLADYQHLHPEPVTGNNGQWTVPFTPRLSGVYRIFADFSPRATGRGLYAAADFPVASPVGPDLGQAGATTSDEIAPRFRYDSTGSTKVEPYIGGATDRIRWKIETNPAPILAGRQTELMLRLRSNDGRPIALSPVMDAYAHLVAFDPARTGYAHLHPVETDLLKKPDALTPTFRFKVTIPLAGRYVIWAQLVVDGEERFQRFDLNVAQ